MVQGAGRSVGAGGRAFLALVVVALLLGGCASSGLKVLDYHAFDAKEGKPKMWPAPPDVPRYIHGGYLVGERNFRSPEARKGFWDTLRWLVFGDEPPVELQRPLGVVVDAAGRILVSDISRGAVVVFDQAKGALQLWQAVGDGESFVSPSGIALGRGGEVFVSDPAQDMVVRLNANGEPQGSFGKGVMNRPTGLAYNPATDTLFVSDTYNHVLREYSPDGQLLRTIGARGTDPGTFNFPGYLAIRGNELYVSDAMNARVQVLQWSDGKPLRSIGQRGTYLGQLGLPKGIAVDSEGNLYVIESMYDHLLVFNRNGDFLMGIGGNGLGDGQFYLPAGVWVDDKDRVFVADMFNGRISVFQFLGGGDLRGFEH